MRCTPRQGGSGEGVNLGNVDRGLEVGGLFVTFERLAVAFEPIIDGSLADIGIRQGIIQCEGMVIAGEGFVQATELFESGGFFYMGFGMVTVEGENFLEANEGAAGLLQIEEGFSRIQQGREALADPVGGRQRGWRHHHRPYAALDGSQGCANVQHHHHQAGSEKNAGRDRDFELSAKRADGFSVLFRGGRELPLRILDDLEGGLLLGLNLAGHLQGEVCQT